MLPKKQSSNSQTAYNKVLMANAATSAFRLHQRLPPIKFTREFLSLLLMEDSCHYLFFSLIFLYVSPLIIILAPVVLFAVLHSASYSLTLLDVSSQILFVEEILLDDPLMSSIRCGRLTRSNILLN